MTNTSATIGSGPLVDLPGFEPPPDPIDGFDRTTRERRARRLDIARRVRDLTEDGAELLRAARAEYDQGGQERSRFLAAAGIDGGLQEELHSLLGCADGTDELYAAMADLSLAANPLAPGA